MKSYRLLPIALAMLLLGVFVAACSPASAPQTTGTAAPPAAGTIVPQLAAKQELIIGAPADTYVLDPPEKATLGMYATNTGIYDGLVRVTPDYQVEPMLATSWEFVAPNTWRFKLRPGITFHDGQKFTAQAVKFTLDRIAKAGGGTPGIGPDSVKIVDDLTVEVTPSRPNLRLIQQLTHPQYSMIAPGSEPATKPVGTGPFKFVEYVKGERIVVERNPDFWGDKAKLNKMTFRFYPDDNTRVLALKSGEVQLVYDPPRDITAELSGTPGLKVATSKVGAYEALYTNAHGTAPYDIGSDPLVREAIALAVDKTSIVRDMWRGNAEVNASMIPVRILGDSANLIKGVASDPAKAKQLLDRAGWPVGADGIRSKAGRKLSLVLVVGFPTPEIHRPMPELVQAQLKAVGIDLKLEITPDSASYSARLKAGTGDLWAELGNQNDANPCFLPDLLFYSKGTGDYAKLFAPGDKFDKFIEGCRSAVTAGDVQKNAAQAMQVLVDDEHIVVPLAGIFRIYALKNTVQGFEPHASRTNQRWEGVWLSQ